MWGRGGGGGEWKHQSGSYAPPPIRVLARNLLMFGFRFVGIRGEGETASVGVGAGADAGVGAFVFPGAGIDVFYLVFCFMSGKFFLCVCVNFLPYLLLIFFNILHFILYHLLVFFCVFYRIVCRSIKYFLKSIFPIYITYFAFFPLCVLPTYIYLIFTIIHLAFRYVPGFSVSDSKCRQ